jgi:hypothetical protein
MTAGSVPVFLAVFRRSVPVAWETDAEKSSEREKKLHGDTSKNLHFQGLFVGTRFATTRGAWPA